MLCIKIFQKILRRKIAKGKNNIEEYDVDSYDAKELQHILNNDTFGDVNKRCLQ